MTCFSWRYPDGLWDGLAQRQSKGGDSALFVLDEHLHFANKISSQLQDLLHVVMFSHF